MHFVFGSITTAFAKPVCPGRPRALRKKGRVDGRIRSDKSEGEQQRGQMGSGERPFKQSQIRNGTRIHLFFDAENLRPKSERGQKAFWLLGFLILSVCVSFLFIRARLSFYSSRKDLQEG
jgi:hypothetical protein